MTTIYIGIAFWGLSSLWLLYIFYKLVGILFKKLSRDLCRFGFDYVALFVSVLVLLLITIK